MPGPGKRWCIRGGVYLDRLITLWWIYSLVGQDLHERHRAEQSGRCREPGEWHTHEAREDSTAGRIPPPRQEPNVFDFPTQLKWLCPVALFCQSASLLNPSPGARQSWPVPSLWHWHFCCSFSTLLRYLGCVAAVGICLSLRFGSPGDCGYVFFILEFLLPSCLVWYQTTVSAPRNSVSCVSESRIEWICKIWAGPEGRSQHGIF